MAKLRVKHPVVLFLAVIFALPAVVLGVGFIFHTDFDPDLFGKYSWGYAAFLAAWWLLVAPGAFLFGRWLFGTQMLKTPRGGEIAVRPRHKIFWLIAIGLPLLVAAAWLVEYRLKQHTFTFHTDVFHPFLQNTPKRHRDAYEINKWGFRGEAIEKEKPQGTYRIFMLGGSTAFCGGIPYEKTHCGLLEAALRQRYPERTIEVQNAAADWHTSQHSLIKLVTNIIDFDPDMVIIFHGINDLMRGFTPDDFADDVYRADYSHYYGPVANFVHPRGALRTMFTMYFGYWFSDFRADRVRVLGPDGEGLRGARMLFFPKSEEVGVRRFRSLPSFERNLREFIAAAQRHGMDVLVGNQPFLYREDLEGIAKEVIWFPQSHHDDGTRPSIESMIRGMNEFNDASESIAREADVTFVDLEAAVPRTLKYFWDDVHYTRRGNQAVANALFETIVQARLLEEE